MMERILAIWRGAAASTVELAILDGRVERAVFTLGLADHAAGLTDAVLLLARSDMTLQAVPLVRMTLECGVTAAWLAVTPGSGEAANADSAIAHARLEHAMEDLADPLGRPEREKARKAEKARATAANRERGQTTVTPGINGEAKLFEQRCAAIDGGEWFYPYYRFLSAYSHGGPALLEHYGRAIEATEDNPLGLEYDPQRTFEAAGIVLAVQAIALMTAVRAWDDIAPGHSIRAQLDEVANDMGAVFELRRRAVS